MRAAGGLQGVRSASEMQSNCIAGLTRHDDEQCSHDKFNLAQL